MKLPVYILTSLLAFTSCGLLGGSNSDDGPPRTIVFSAQDNDGAFQIYLMREDGSGMKQLTEGEYSSTEPAWSPDGSRIAYSRSTGSTAGEALWVMDADGSNKQPLVINPRTDGPQLGNRPAWSPDGSKLAFDQCLNCEMGGLNYEIFIADLQTGIIDTLTNNYAFNIHPVWSPDGSRIAFTSDRSNPEQSGDIYLMILNTNKVIKITETGNAGRQTWLPKGNQLIYWTNNDLFQFNLTDSTKKILNVNLPSEEGFRPLDVSPEGENILLHTFNLNVPKENQSLEILNLKSGEIKKIAMYPKLDGADWYAPEVN